MSFFGGGAAQGQMEPKVDTLQVQRSAYGTARKLIYGTVRVPGDFLDIVDFKVTLQSDSVGKGGGGQTQSRYLYSITALIAIGDGPLTDFGRAWSADNPPAIYTHAKLATRWVLEEGELDQLPWSYMSSKHPGRDLAYPGIGYLHITAWSLGGSALPPQVTWEVTGKLPFSASIRDAEPSVVVYDLLTDEVSGAVFPVENVGDFTQYRKYCTANSFFLGLLLDSQKPALEVLQELLEMTNSEAFWEDGLLKLTPYGDTQITANGETFIPNLAPVATLDDDAFAPEGPDSPPLEVLRSRPSDAFNKLRIEYTNRSNNYKVEPVTLWSQAEVDLFKLRTAATKTWKAITTGLFAATAGQLYLQRVLSVRNQYKFGLLPNFIQLSPMDIVSITEPSLNMGQPFLARIVEIELTEEERLLCTAEDLGVGSLNPDGRPSQVGAQVAGGGIGSSIGATTPPDVNAPVFVEPSALAVETPELWVGISGQEQNEDWGGCQVHYSEDAGTTYKLLQETKRASITGSLLADLASYGGANPDNAHTVEVDLLESGGSLESISNALADQYYNLIAICDPDWTNLELLSFTLQAAGAGDSQYSLSRLNRGLYGTTPTLHATGSRFLFLGLLQNLQASVLKWRYPLRLAGRDLLFKFASFNMAGQELEDLGDCVPYIYRLRATANVSAEPPLIRVASGPTPGFHSAGEVFIYPALNRGGPLGIKCIEPGEPGTWVEIGDISPDVAAVGAAALSVPWRVSLATVPPATGLHYAPEALVIPHSVQGAALGLILTSIGQWVDLGYLMPDVKATVQSQNSLPWNVVVASEVTAGPHSVPDAIIYPTQVAGKYAGKICIAPGTPGTWAEFLPLGPFS